jgi:uncharacterized protein
MVVSFITNGTLISKELVETLKSYKDMVIVTVSIDGPRLVHNLNRVYPNGSGSYDDVLKGINMIKDEEITFELQITYPIDAYKVGYTPFDVALFLSQYTPFIVLKFADYNRYFKTGREPADGLLSELFINYVVNSINELTKDKPAFYDQNLAIGLSFLARKAVKADPCPFPHFITILPNGIALTCHMITDFVLGNIMQEDITTLMKKHKHAIEFNRRLASILDYRDFWYSSVQDVCPAELLGGLTKILSKSEKVRLDSFAKSVMESFWDAFILSVYKHAKEGSLQKIYSNIEYVFENLYKEPRK